MVDTKVSALSALAAPGVDDLVYVVDDPSGTPTSYKATVQSLLQAPQAVVRVSSNGARTIYPPTASTDAARGTALGTAIAAASAGDVIYLAPGGYTRTAAITSIPNDLTIVGSRGVTITGSGVDICDVANVYGLTVRGLKSFGRWKFSGGRRVLFDGVEFDSTAASNGQCVYVDAVSADAYDWWFENCLFLPNAADEQVYFNGGGDRLRFHGCTFWYAATIALRLYNLGAESAETEAWSGPIIQGCHFRNAGTVGLYLDGVHDPVVNGNTFEDCGTRAIYVKAPIETVITGNMIERNNQTVGDQAGVEVEIVDATGYAAMSAEAPIIIANNQFGLEDCAVLITGSFNQEASIKISGNHIFKCDAGVKITGYRAAYLIAIDNNLFAPGVGSPVTAISAVASSAPATGTKLKIRGNDIDGHTTGIELDGITNVLSLNNDATNTTTAQSLLNSATVRTS